MTKKQRKNLIRILITAAALVFLQLIRLPAVPRLIAYLAVYVLIGYDILRKAWKGILNGRPFDENFLMAIATVGAFALALYSGSGDYLEAIAVMLFYQTGELFQSIAVGKSRNSIRELMDIRPDYANIETGGKLERTDPDEVPVGTVIVVQPGEKIPIDGIVAEGVSALNTSALTGESVPRTVRPGEEALSGCINLNSVIKIRTTKEFGESTASKILDLVENASSRKSRSEAFISRFARIYTPAVVFSALALAVIPPLACLLFLQTGPQWGVWIYRTLTFLVISCPCALVISIPLSFFAGLGGAGREGILIKGSNYLELLSRTKTVVFDKTGTLTQGVFAVSGVHHNTLEEERLIEYAALAECASSHPIAISLRSAYGREIDRSRVTDLNEISGHGVTCKADGHAVAVGNGKLMNSLDIPCIDCSSRGTVVHIAIDGEYAGHIVISDLEKPTAKAAVEALKQTGVQSCIMLTGDSRPAAEKTAAGLGLDAFHAELLPQQKVEVLESLLAQKKSGRDILVFAGDGINDAPVLSRADIGIAMGALGSDAAIEAADVVLMDDDPVKIAKAIRISRKCIRIVFQNIVFALAVKFACLILGALGYANMWAAIFADVGVMVIAVLNAIRALRVHNL